MDSSLHSFPVFEATGVRGSHVVTDPLFQHFGGDTTSLLLTSSRGDRLLVDAGSGLFRLNPLLASDKALHLFLTHPHVDHITGILFFDPLFYKNRDITIYCSASTQQALKKFFAPPLFPVSIENLPSPPKWSLRPTEGVPATFTTPSFTCEAIPIPHPGGAFALLVTETETGHSLLVLNDCELSPDEPFELQLGLQPLLSCLAKHGPVDSVIIDAMYEPEEFSKHKGWGHSDYKTAIRFGLHIQARQIYLAHHNPNASDAILHKRQEEITVRNVAILRQNHQLPWSFSPCNN
jgi:phosphoribosyl 1,2-cyclic phosphodiesterase